MAGAPGAAYIRPLFLQLTLLTKACPAVTVGTFSLQPEICHATISFGVVGSCIPARAGSSNAQLGKPKVDSNTF